MTIPTPTTPARLTPEREREIRAIVEERTRFRDDGGFVTHSEMDLVLLFAELDAVRKELTELRESVAMREQSTERMRAE